MIICEWQTFSTDSETYTKKLFEETVGDEFEAMLIKDGEEIPRYIWTTNFVIIVQKNSKLFTDISFEKLPRNPYCE